MTLECLFKNYNKYNIYHLDKDGLYIRSKKNGAEYYVPFNRTMKQVYQIIVNKTEKEMQAAFRKFAGL